MKVLVDARGLLEEAKAGVEGYTLNMLDNLQRMYPDDEYILFSFSRSKKPDEDMLKRFFWVHKNWSDVIVSLKWKIGIGPNIDEMVDGVDLVWYPNVRFFPVTSRVKTVVTVHDISFELMKECYTWRRRFWHWRMEIGKNLKRMSGIVAVSRSTAEDLEYCYGVDSDKICTIYSGLKTGDIPSDNQVLKKYKLKTKKYLMVIGTLEPRKNILGTLKAFNIWLKNVADKKDDLKLVLVGGQGWGSDGDLINDFIDDNGLNDRVKYFGYMKESEKSVVLKYSAGLLYCSFYEGFGFPPLEALSLEVPVVSSFGGSLGEVLQDKCLLVDPFDIPGLVKLYEEIQREKASFGLGVFDDDVKDYDWKNTARNFREYLKKLL